MSQAVRNRAIKSTLESVFGRGKVTVRGSRGTAYGYVNVCIDWTPLDIDQSQRMQGELKALLIAAGIDLGRTYRDDTCQHTTDMCHIGFNQSRFFRTMKHADGSMSVIRDYYDSEWETIAAE